MEEAILQKLKSKLEERREKLERELQLIANPTEDGDKFKTRYEDIGEHKDENATEVENYVDDLAIKKTLEEQLKNVKDALQKMEEGTYGICEECGGKIRSARLEIYPSARRCMQCAQKDSK